MTSDQPRDSVRWGGNDADYARIENLFDELSGIRHDTERTTAYLAKSLGEAEAARYARNIKDISDTEAFLSALDEIQTRIEVAEKNKAADAEHAAWKTTHDEEVAKKNADLEFRFQVERARVGLPAAGDTGDGVSSGPDPVHRGSTEPSSFSGGERTNPESTSIRGSSPEIVIEPRPEAPGALPSDGRLEETRLETAKLELEAAKLHEKNAKGEHGPAAVIKGVAAGAPGSRKSSDGFGDNSKAMMMALAQGLANRGGGEGGSRGGGIMRILASVSDGPQLPVVGDVIESVYNLLLIFKAIANGCIGTAVLMFILGAIDLAIGMAAAGGYVAGGAPGVMIDLFDMFFCSAVINGMLLDRALAKKEVKKNNKIKEPQGGIFSDADGRPTTFAMFFFLMLFFTPFYGMFTGSPILIVVGVGLLVMFLLQKAFREEFFGDGRWRYSFFFIATLALHIMYHTYGGFALSESWYGLKTIILNLGMYFVISIGFIVLSYVARSQNPREDVTLAMGASLFAVLAYAVPGLVSTYLPSATLKTVVVFVVMFFPVWPLYMLHAIEKDSGGGYSHGLFSVFLMAIVIIALFYFVNGLLTMAIQLPSGGVIKQDIPGVVPSFGGELMDKWDSIGKKIGIVKTQIEDPGAYYRSSIEDGESGKPQGVLPPVVRLQSAEVSPEEPVVADLQLKMESSFLGEPVTVAAACYIDAKDPGPGTVDVPVVELLPGLSSSVTCTIPPPHQRGSHELVASAEFPFETWSYVKYTFVDYEFARNLGSQGKDVRTVLGISEEAEAVSTDSPIAVGMGGTSQPIPIDVEGTPIVPVGKKIGLTLDNSWAKGKLKTVHRIELKVPAPFALKQDSCTRPVTRVEADPNDGLLTTYTFEPTEEDTTAVFTTINCQLEIPESSREEARKLLAGKRDSKLQMTFVGVAAYTYVIESKTAVRIR